MILSLGDLMSKGTTYAGGRADWPASEASFWANAAYHEVASRFNLHRGLESTALSSTTSGGNYIALPADFDIPLAFTLFIPSASTLSSTGTQVIPLRMRDSRWMDSQAISGDPATNSVAGIPEAYILYGQALQLWPSPNSAYSMQLRYSTKPAVLVNSTDTIVLDDRWHMAVLWKTVEFLEGSRDNREGEAAARVRYLTYVSSTPNDFAIRQRERSGMVMRLKWRGSDGLD